MHAKKNFAKFQPDRHHGFHSTALAPHNSSSAAPPNDLDKTRCNLSKIFLAYFMNLRTSGPPTQSLRYRLLLIRAPGIPGMTGGGFIAMEKPRNWDWQDPA
jgi:hypothetical protein